ncbi:sigma 54-interacting transcriptional regulator [Candidatus Poribacteria bacterium]|nr:sigma 54-interacting transcriptional regulator [Candidatus Poribacteria bacterium]
MIDEIIGVSEAIRETRDMVRKMAGSDIDVLILGETGVGKELVAKTIHRMSRRSAKPFIPIDCGLLPKTLAEEELFGHVKGSFTGAISTKEGLVQTADGGICFFDEIGELSRSSAWNFR